jgi:hypothetical protein
MDYNEQAQWNAYQAKRNMEAEIDRRANARADRRVKEATEAFTEAMKSPAEKARDEAERQAKAAREAAPKDKHGRVIKKDPVLCWDLTVPSERFAYTNAPLRNEVRNGVVYAA